MVGWPGMRQRDPLSLGLRWYVAATYPKQEATAQEALSAKGFDTYCPQLTTITLAKSPAGSVVAEVCEPLFDGYVFVALDLAQHRTADVNGAGGIHKLLPLYAERPLPLRVGVVEALLERGEFVDDKRPAKPTLLNPDDVVRVSLDGKRPIEAKVVLQRGDRVDLLMRIFGRESPVTALMSQLELAYSSPCA